MAAAAAAGRAATVACLQVEGAFRLLQGAVEISDGWCVGPCVACVRACIDVCDSCAVSSVRVLCELGGRAQAAAPRAATAVGRLDVLVLL